MNKLLIILALGSLVACSSTEQNDSAAGTEATEQIKPETSEQVQKAQDANVELEKLDGELDSLINTL